MGFFRSRMSFKTKSLTSGRDEDVGILCGRGFQSGHFFPERLDIFLHEVAVIYRSEQDPALPLALSLPTVSATFWPTTGWHSSSGRSSGWGKKRRKLDVTVPDSVPSLLLRHDVIEPFLRGRKLALWPARGDFPSGVTIRFCHDGRSGCGRRRERRWNEWGM